MLRHRRSALSVDAESNEDEAVAWINQAFSHRRVNSQQQAVGVDSVVHAQRVTVTKRIYERGPDQRLTPAREQDTRDASVATSLQNEPSEGCGRAGPTVFGRKRAERDNALT